MCKTLVRMLLLTLVLSLTMTLPAASSQSNYDKPFNASFYLAEYPDLQAAFGTDYQAALDHWMVYGIHEGRRGSPEFDVQFYLSKYPDLQAAFGTDYQGYCAHSFGNRR